MKVIRQVSAVLMTVSWCAGFLFFLLHYQFSFNYEIEQSNQYYLILALPLLFANLIISVFTRRGSFSKRELFCLLTVVIFCCLIIFSDYYSFANEYFFVFGTAYIFNSCIVLARCRGCVYAILAFLLGVYLFELYLGFQQWIGSSYNNDVALLIQGTLENSGVYACYLVIHLPLLYFVTERLILKFNKHYYVISLHIIQILLLGINLFLVWQTKSRTAFIALFITTASLLYIKYGSIIWRRILLLPKVLLVSLSSIAFGGLIAGIYHLFYMKKMSAIGRLMKTEITLKNCGDEFWTGTGIGRFTWYYPQWQAAYFKNTCNPPKEYFLSAGESYILFNEYLQWFVTVGMIGSVFMIILLVFFFKAKSAIHGNLFNMLKLMVLAIMGCCFTSYPLHVNAFLLLLGFCFAIVLSRADYKRYLNWSLTARCNRLRVILFPFILAAIVSVIFGLATLKGLDTYHTIRRWQQLRDLGTTNTNVLKQYAGFYSNLKMDGKFLTDYGTLLMEDTTQTEQAVKILKEASHYFINRYTMELLIKAHIESRQINEAIVAQEWLCNFLPNKFRIKLNLLKMYQVARDSSGVARIANIILDMPVKVYSEEVYRIKEEAKQVLENQKNF